MSRYTGPKCKLCRREGTKLFLKGARCMSEKCAVTKRNQLPGQHFRSRKRETDYGRHLREKQKAKRIYGIFEAQFRRYFEEASRQRGVTGFVLLQILERRLDNLLYISGLSESRAQARKLITQKKVSVNGNIVNRPSFLVSPEMLVSRFGYEVKPKEEVDTPPWVQWDKDALAVKVVKLPEKDDIKTGINDQLIVEFYSR